MNNYGAQRNKFGKSKTLARPLIFCQKKDTAILYSYTNIGDVRLRVGGDILNLKSPIYKNLQNSKKKLFSTSFLVMNHDCKKTIFATKSTAIMIEEVVWGLENAI